MIVVGGRLLSFEVLCRKIEGILGIRVVREHVLFSKGIEM